MTLGTEGKRTAISDLINHIDLGRGVRRKAPCSRRSCVPSTHIGPVYRRIEDWENAVACLPLTQFGGHVGHHFISQDSRAKGDDKHGDRTFRFPTAILVKTTGTLSASDGAAPSYEDPPLSTMAPYGRKYPDHVFGHSRPPRAPLWVSRLVCFSQKELEVSWTCSLATRYDLSVIHRPYYGCSTRTNTKQWKKFCLYRTRFIVL